MGVKPNDKTLVINMPGPSTPYVHTFHTLHVTAVGSERVGDLPLKPHN